MYYLTVWRLHVPVQRAGEAACHLASTLPEDSPLLPAEQSYHHYTARSLSQRTAYHSHNMWNMGSVD